MSAAKTAGLGDVGGALGVENTVVANNASIKLGACCTTAPTVNNVQTVSYDPTAIANVNLNTVGGDVDVANTAVANNLSIEGRVAQIEQHPDLFLGPGQCDRQRQPRLCRRQRERQRLGHWQQPELEADPRFLRAWRPRSGSPDRGAFLCSMSFYFHTSKKQVQPW